MLPFKCQEKEIREKIRKVGKLSSRYVSSYYNDAATVQSFIGIFENLIAIIMTD